MFEHTQPTPHRAASAVATTLRAASACASAAAATKAAHKLVVGVGGDGGFRARLGS